MASKALVSYIKQQIEAGYDQYSIKLGLVRRGHSMQDVEAAISEAQKPSAQKKQFPTMLVIITIIFAVIIVLFFVLMKLRAPEAAPEEKIPAPEKEAIPEKGLPEGEGEEKIIVPGTKEEQIMPEEKGAPQIPVEVLQKANITRVNWTQIDYIQQRSIGNKEGALILCSELETAQEKDLCYFTLAKTASDFNICGRITGTVVRDQCYFTFATTGKNVCDKITDSIAKEGCKQLVSLNITIA